MQKVINAPPTQWSECADGNVFATPDGADTSLPSAMTVLGGVIERTQNVVIGHGALDMVLIANGTLLAIQNMTWGGELGFRSPPAAPFYVPYHHHQAGGSAGGALGTLAGAGVLGTTHTERGLTYVGVDLSGHMVPQYAPSAAFRHLEFLLGRVSSLSSTEPFTVGAGAGARQLAEPLGNSTAPQCFSSPEAGAGARAASGTATGNPTKGSGAGSAARGAVPGVPVVLVAAGAALLVL